MKSFTIILFLVWMSVLRCTNLLASLLTYDLPFLIQYKISHPSSSSITDFLKSVGKLTDVILWDKKFSGETQDTYLLTPNREPLTDQSPDTPEI